MAYIEVMQKSIYTQNQLRFAHQQLAVQFKPELFLTLATNQQMSIAKVKSKAQEFLKRMDEAMLGRNWAKAPKSKRLDGLFYIEHEQSNIHAHGLLTRPYCNILGLQFRAEEIWKKLCPSGSVVVKDVGDVTERSEYVTKEAFKHGFFERQFFMAAA